MLGEIRAILCAFLGEEVLFIGKQNQGYHSGNRWRYHQTPDGTKTRYKVSFDAEDNVTNTQF